MRRLVQLALLGVLFGLSVEVHADSSEEESIKVRWRQGVAALSFSLDALVDDEVREQLKTGLKKRFAITASAHRKGTRRPIASRRVERTITYDLWDEAYIVRAEPKGRFASMNQAIARCLKFKDLHVGTREDYASRSGQQIYFTVRGEYNPVSKQQCRALVRPGASADPLAPLVVNLVHRKICVAERMRDLPASNVLVVE